MKTRIEWAVIPAGFLFTGLCGGVAAQTPQTANLIYDQVQTAPGAAHDPRLMQVPPRKAASLEEGVYASASPSAAGRTLHFKSFDAPGAVNVTYPYAINLEGAVTGYFNDANFAGHGFLRSPDGTLSTFDVPGAGTGNSQGTFAYAINDLGVIAGYYCDANNICPGFVRDREGKFTTFDVAGDVNGTYPSGINLEGRITGFELDANLVYHGFVRTPNGTITTFDGPDANTGLFEGTSPADINLEGTVSGCYYDANSVSHGFLRARSGAITTFDVPGGSSIWCYNYQSTEFGLSSEGLRISLTGAITGSYFEPISGNPFGGNWRGFLRYRDGTFKTFDATPNPSSPCCTWTWGIATNLAGAIVGFENDSHNINHGFLRTSNGTVTLLDAPDASTGNNQGTVANAINIFGWITGSYIDANGVRHGALWIP